MSNIAKYKPAALGDFFTGLKIGPRDDVKIRIRGGFATAHLKRADGHVQSATVMLDGPFQLVSSCDPTNMTPAKRRKVVHKLHTDGLKQVAIAELLGVSQATVSLDLKMVRFLKVRSKRR